MVRYLLLVGVGDGREITAHHLQTQVANLEPGAGVLCNGTRSWLVGGGGHVLGFLNKSQPSTCQAHGLLLRALECALRACSVPKIRRCMLVMGENEPHASSTTPRFPMGADNRLTLTSNTNKTNNDKTTNRKWGGSCSNQGWACQAYPAKRGSRLASFRCVLCVGTLLFLTSASNSSFFATNNFPLNNQYFRLFSFPLLVGGFIPGRGINFAQCLKRSDEGQPPTTAEFWLITSERRESKQRRLPRSETEHTQHAESHRPASSLFLLLLRSNSLHLAPWYALGPHFRFVACEFGPMRLCPFNSNDSSILRLHLSSIHPPPRFN